MPESLFKPLRYRIGLIVAWWAVAQFMLIVEMRSGLPFRWALSDALIGSSLLAGGVSLVACVFRYYLPGRNRHTYILALCATLTVIWVFGSYALLLALPDPAPVRSYFTENLMWVRAGFAFLILGCMALMSMLWYTLQDRQATERRRNETEALARNAELNNLRQQLQPHFLFNSLNSINTLIGSHPRQARQMVQQLSEFLRGTLKQDQLQWATLEAELEHLALYLEIEKVRFGHRLRTEVVNEAGEAALPVLLLQPIVENAIKFGLYDTTEAICIRIHAEQADGDLLLTVTNPYDRATSAPRRGTGFGLSSVQRRLFLLFARNDLLQTEAGEEIFTTRIKIPQP